MAKEDNKRRAYILSAYSFEEKKKSYLSESEPENENVPLVCFYANFAFKKSYFESFELRLASSSSLINRFVESNVSLKNF